MTSKKTFLLVSLLTIVFTLGVLWVSVGWQRASRLARFSAEAEAQITRLDFTGYRTGSVSRDRTDTVVDERAGKRRRTTHIRYRYTVENREIEVETIRRGDQRGEFTVGMRVKACYDPQHPEESVLVAADERCGGS